MRVMAIQIEDELFEEFKTVIGESGKTQKAYVIDMIQQTVDAQKQTQAVTQDTEERPVKWEQDDVVQALDSFLMEHERVPSQKEFRSENGLPSYNAAQRCLEQSPAEYCIKRLEEIREGHEQTEVSSNQKYVDEHSDDFAETKFYIDGDLLKEVYYNPDSNAGGQLVTNFHSPDAILEIYEQYGMDEDFFAYLEGGARQYLTDIDAENFMSEAEKFVNDPCDFEGATEETINALRDWAEGMDQSQDHSQGMSM